MSALPEELKFTYDDYKLLPEDKRAELIDGDLLMTPAPGIKHQSISIELASLLFGWVKEHDLGTVLAAPTDVYLSHYDVVQPDVLFIEKSREGIIEEAKIYGPPDLVIEILSPSTQERDLFAKRKLYSKHGVREYWIVNPKAKNITVYLFQKNKLKEDQSYPKGSVVRSTVVDGFALAADKIFA